MRVPRSPCEEDPDNRIYPYDYYPVPDVVDWDGDGDWDLLAGGYITGKIFYYENIATFTESDPRLVYRGPLRTGTSDIDVTWCASPCAADFDQDGDLDLVSGAMQMSPGGGDQSDPDQFLFYFENTGTRESPRLVQRPFPAKGRFCFGMLGTPRPLDFNLDGLTDLVVSSGSSLLMIPNIGSSTSPLFDATVLPLKMRWGNAPLDFQQVLDFNRDGWPDLFTGTEVRLNDGKGIPATFSSSVFFDHTDAIHHPSPTGDELDSRCLADLDHDGRTDLLFGDHRGFVWFHRNIGSEKEPVLDPGGQRILLDSGEPIRVGKPPENSSAFDMLQGARTGVAAGDYNRDGYPDLAICDTYGFVRLYKRIPGEELKFSDKGVVARIHPVRLTIQSTDWNGDCWEDLLLSYACGQVYVVPNSAIDEKAVFGEPIPLEIPPCFGSPQCFAADWNADGDKDLLIQQYGMLRFVERSFLEGGYMQAEITSVESRSREGEDFKEPK